MFTKTITAVATAAVLSAGAFAASTSAADAHYSTGYYETRSSPYRNDLQDLLRDDLVGYDYYNQPIYKSVPYKKCETIYVNEYEKIFVPTLTYNYSYGYHSGY